MAKAHATSMASSGQTKNVYDWHFQSTLADRPLVRKTIHVRISRLNYGSLPDKGPTSATIAICEISGNPNISATYKRKPQFTLSRYDFLTHPNTRIFLSLHEYLFSRRRLIVGSVPRVRLTVCFYLCRNLFLYFD